MRKNTMIFLAVACFTSFMISDAMAGLINYNRAQKRKTGGGAAAPARPAAAAPAPAPKPAQDTRPMWMRQVQNASTATEKKYDVNRDGLLQTAEVKIYLRDVAQVVEAKGGYTVDSEVLRDYDKNRDGVITRYELADIRTDSSR